MEELVATRKKAGVSQQDLAREMGLNQTALSRIESGVVEAPAGFRLDVLSALARISERRGAVIMEAAEKAA